MKVGFSQQEIITTAKSLGLPTDGFIQRRVARAQDLVYENKVSQIDDGIFRVRSQYEPDKAYIVNVNHGAPYCNCPDGERTINCKHRIASLLYAQRQAQAQTIIKTTDGNEGDYWRRCWCIAQGNRRTLVYEERNGRLFCNCGANLKDCKHKQLVIKTVMNSLARIVNECGSNEAKALQDKMNGQLDSQNNNGNGANKAPSQPQLDLSDPFQECESYDIDQIEGRPVCQGTGRRNGELCWKLENGKYCISYAGVMKLADKHNISFSVSLHDDTNTVIAKAMNGNERVSGKPMNGCTDTAIELAKRNAARQLLPLVEIKAVEHKAKLEAEFSWRKAYDKCVKLVGGKSQLDCIIYDLVKDGKLRQDNPSHYDRTEWLIIHHACKGRKCALSSTKQDSSNNNSCEGRSNHGDPSEQTPELPNNADDFVSKCKEAIAKVRDEKKSIEANDQPLQKDNGSKRKLMMDKKLKTWLVESDGTKKEISCREICEQFESKQNPSIVTRLRAGIDDGADISTVELDN